ncbi:MAG: DUF433 domain-containing protein [Nostoc sp. EfeVER01]|uniref:DUF433 domain-containing protein n=1 Tax=unclassified Nostoc TaxID=2593658 RepID=UPI002AD55531|nr:MULTISPECIES: DUF433 domain-containing protein [unclassified Nostoc]MDZ7945486.1 DUF433 domain-containing protein [Nostoc sp. EfeVER01]MDZ7994422.1 DUF433 domain-containing protein [Nostoc sp. EspVER01]
MSTKHIAEYFNFLSSEDIRLKDSRIGIETILYEYIDCGRSPEEIAQTYQTISLEQVYATILLIIALASKDDEYQDRIVYLPLPYK